MSRPASRSTPRTCWSNWNRRRPGAACGAVIRGSCPQVGSADTDLGTGTGRPTAGRRGRGGHVSASRTACPGSGPRWATGQADRVAAPGRARLGCWPPDATARCEKDHSVAGSGGQPFPPQPQRCNNAVRCRGGRAASLRGPSGPRFVPMGAAGRGWQAAAGQRRRSRRRAVAPSAAGPRATVRTGHTGDRRRLPAA